MLGVADYGAFVRLRDGVEAIIPSSEIPPGTDLSPGARLRAEVANVDSQDRRITMSLRDVGTSDQAEQFQALSREKQANQATLGDVLKGKLAEKLQAMASRATEDNGPGPGPGESGDAGGAS